MPAVRVISFADRRARVALRDPGAGAQRADREPLRARELTHAGGLRERDGLVHRDQRGTASDLGLLPHRALDTRQVAADFERGDHYRPSG
jgi:hypothetical protein